LFFQEGLLQSNEHQNQFIKEQTCKQLIQPQQPSF
jgi:hypothetical protein